nr:MBL fold metallo-hydrolase [uncultured Actinoplanes sp.]
MRDFGVSRRQFLVAAGAGVLGVAVLDTVTACSSDDGGGNAGTTGDTPGAEADLGGWKRVDLAVVSAYLLIRGNEAAVVDLGTGGSADSIEAALKAAGSGWGNVKHIVITHLHDDHAGGIPGVPAGVRAGFYAGEQDAPNIITDRTIKPVKDGDDVFGLRIIGTPGHTLGHISVFDASLGVLVSGDALRTSEGLAGSDPQFTADPQQAAASVRKLARLDVKAILPGHGSPMTAGAAEELRKLAATIS